jgi:hypothetical protein
MHICFFPFMLLWFLWHRKSILEQHCLLSREYIKKKKVRIEIMFISLLKAGPKKIRTGLFCPQINCGFSLRGVPGDMLVTKPKGMEGQGGNFYTGFRMSGRVFHCGASQIEENTMQWKHQFSSTQQYWVATNVTRGIPHYNPCRKSLEESPYRGLRQPSFPILMEIIQHKTRWLL